MRRRVSIYKSYSPERRQETAGVQNNRSWVRASPACFFSHIDVGNAFQFISHISAVCLPLALSLFSHVDVGDAFQVINQISGVRLLPAHFNK